MFEDRSSMWVKPGVSGTDLWVQGLWTAVQYLSGGARTSQTIYCCFSRTIMKKVYLFVREGKHPESREKRIGRGRWFPLSPVYPICLGYPAHQRSGKWMSLMRETQAFWTTDSKDGTWQLNVLISSFAATSKGGDVHFSRSFAKIVFYWRTVQGK